MRRTVLMFLVLVLLTATAPGDVVHMRDGSTREGRIVSQTEDVIVIEVMVGGVKAEITLKRDKVDRIEKKLTPHQKLMSEHADRLRRLDLKDTQAVVDFANWCIAKKLFDHAETIYGRLIERDEEGFARGHLELARIEHNRRRTSRAKEHLAALLGKKPDHPAAKLLLKEIVEFELKAVERLLAEAVDAFNHRRFEQALDKAERFHDRATKEQKARVITATDFPEDMDFVTFVAEARLRRPCKACTNGAETCPVCKGKTTVDDDLVCPRCGGYGFIVCDKCRGTNLRLDKTPDWELPGVARGLEKRISKSLVELKTLKKALTGKLDPDAALPSAYRANAVAAHTLGLLKEMTRVIAAAPVASTFAVNAEREATLKDVGEIMRNVARAFDGRARTGWEKAKAADDGMLAQNAHVRSARNDAARAAFFYRSLGTAAGELPADVKPRVAALDKSVAEMDRVLVHNAKLIKALTLTVRLLRRDDFSKALGVMVEIVSNASKADLTELSKRVGKEVNFNLPDLMAHCRFELGKDKAEFGTTTEYERPAFVKKLLTEADTAVQQAEANYLRMRGLRDSGRRLQTPVGLVRRTRNFARDARKWYRAALEIPYPIAERKKQRIEEHIDRMDEIISRCNGWFRGGTPVGN